jgi:hypothetical protein
MDVVVKGIGGYTALDYLIKVKGMGFVRSR